MAPNALVVAQNPFWIPTPTARLFRTATADALATLRPGAELLGT